MFSFGMLCADNRIMPSRITDTHMNKIDPGKNGGTVEAAGNAIKIGNT